MEYAAVIISAIGTIITGVLGLWFKYNQQTKDKLTDLKIEQFKQDQEIKASVAMTDQQSCLESCGTSYTS